RISFYEMPKVLSLAWETILKIEHAFEDKNCQSEDILELFYRLHNDVQNIHEELAVYINTTSWDRPTICYNDDDDEDCPIAIIPILSTEEPDNSLKKSSSSTTTYSEFSLSKYDSFIFDLSINSFPPVDRSDFYHEEFADELAHIISPPEYDCFYFKNEPGSRDFTVDVVEDIFPTREPRAHVHNVLPTHPTLQLNLDFILSNDSLFAYVIWIFLPFLSYPVAPQYILSLGNEDTIFDPSISNYHSLLL
nr:hypothetical protein [Tanacetum cinerariifolium]